MLRQIIPCDNKPGLVPQDRYFQIIQFEWCDQPVNLRWINRRQRLAKARMFREFPDCLKLGSVPTKPGEFEVGWRSGRDSNLSGISLI